MKKKLLIAAAAFALAAAVITVVVLVRKNSTQTVLSDVYKDKEYVEKINAVELNEDLAAAVDGDDLYKVKTAVLENNISEENQQQIAGLVKEYGTENTLVGYSYFSKHSGTWDELTEALESSSKKGWAAVFEEYTESQPAYYEQSFPVDTLEEWIDQKGYSPMDIKALERLSQKTGKDFYELMDEYEMCKSVDMIGAEYGFISAGAVVSSVTASADEIAAAAKKLGTDEQSARKYLVICKGLNGDPDSLLKQKLTIYQLEEKILNEKYGRETQ